jgi:hypothetical protein
MTFELLRPCRYADLTRASVSGALPTLALIADGEPREFTTMINAWRSVVPSTQLCVFHTPIVGESLRMAVGADPTVQIIEVPSYDALTRNSRALACKVWASCASYDAYGVLVKKYLESMTYNILRLNGGTYLAHDSAFGVVRWFDVNGLYDRLYYRNFRVLLYRWICLIGIGLARILSFVSPAEFRWRKIR